MVHGEIPRISQDFCTSELDLTGVVSPKTKWDNAPASLGLSKNFWFRIAGSQVQWAIPCLSGLWFGTCSFVHILGRIIPTD